MGRTLPRLVAGLAALSVLVGGGAIVSNLHKEPILVVDGNRTEVSGFFSTVGDVLKAEGITLGEHDIVAPAISSRVNDGDLISVRFGREVKLNVDGKETSFWTTETNLASALRVFGMDPDHVRLSVDASRSISREGLSVAVTTAKKFSIAVDGQQRTGETFATTVGALLREEKITLADSDHVTPATTEPVSAGIAVVVERG